MLRTVFLKWHKHPQKLNVYEETEPKNMLKFIFSFDII